MYRIKDWDKVFENNRTRELQKMRWVPVPNDFDGDGYTSIMEHDRGAEIYGAWIACVNLASRCEPRGSLVRSGGKYHDAASIARRTRVSLKSVKLMLDFCENVCKWLIPLDAQDGAVKSHDSATGSQASDYGMEWNGRKRIEGKEDRRSRFTPPTVEEVSQYCKERQNSIDPQSFVDFYTSKILEKAGAIQSMLWEAF